jgi:hypothetical protein
MAQINSYAWSLAVADCSVHLNFQVALRDTWKSTFGVKT